VNQVNKAEMKAEIVDAIKGQLAKASFVVLTDFKGSTVAQLNTLRRNFEKNGVQFQVVKNTLARRAIAGTEHEPLAPLFKGNIGVLSASEDPQRMAKLLKETIKDNDKLIVRAGYFDGGVLDQKGVLAVADLPSREQLLTTLLRTIQEGPRQIVSVLQAPARDLLYLLQNFATKLEERGGE
jgi:large subunit ribosomal protein L10